MQLTRHSPPDSPAPCFDFGGAAVSIASDHDGFTGLVRERYEAFATREVPRWRVRYSVTDGRTPSPQFIHAARQHLPKSKTTGRRLELETATYAMTLDRDTRDVELSGPLATYPLDRMIQTLFYETHDRGLILHAAALAAAGRGYVLSGPSGCGKSTMAALFPERALCDEFVGVSLDHDAPVVAALPFWESRRGSAALSGIYCLRHGATNRRRRLDSQEALARMRQEVRWPTFDESSLRRALETFVALVDEIPVWELVFRPGVEVWDVIARKENR